MRILSIDTTSNVCSVSILENDQVIDENILDNGKTHSENMMPLLDELLKRNNMDISNVEFISVCVGPGSFTGIRIGIATIKAFAEVLNIKVASVTSLETLSRNETAERDQVIVPIIDARNNQVYATVFDNEYNQIEDNMADDIENVINRIKKYDNVVFVGNGAIIHKDLIVSYFANSRFSENNKQYSSKTGICGYHKLLKNEVLDADTITPLYLRKSQAERMKNGK